MNKAQQKRYQSLYQQHVNALHRQGKSKSTVDIYSRAVRRVTEYFDRCPDRLTTDDLKQHFTNLVNTHSWSTVKVDRNGLQFFYKHVLDKHWQWVDIVKPPIVKSLPDILTPSEISLMINATRQLRYQTYILTVTPAVIAVVTAARTTTPPVGLNDKAKSCCRSSILW